MSDRAGFFGRAAMFAALGGAFVVVSALLRPDWTRAESPEVLSGVVDDAARDAARGMGSPVRRDGSANPHHTLKSLGSFEGTEYRVEVWASPDGPRSSVYERATGRLLGVLLDIDQLGERFPELDLQDIDFSSQDALMMHIENDAWSGP